MGIINKFVTSEFFGKYLGWGSITRISLKPVLLECFQRLSPGKVLDIGGREVPYRQYIPNFEYKTLDIEDKHEPDICCDVHDIKCGDATFDTVIVTEVLEHCHTPQKVVDEIYRILTKNGYCILSTRFIHPIHPDPHDYYRFTEDSLRYLFRKFKEVQVYAHGNRLQAIWKLLCIGFFSPVAYVLNPIIGKIGGKAGTCPLGYVVFARK